jgi:ABC-type polar amino acid transport system ATPase subunit
MLSAKDVKKKFTSQEVLHGVSVHVEKGKITVLMGPSGSGKTTLLRAISLLDPPTEGEVFVDKNHYSFPMEPGAKIKPPWPKLTVVFQQLFLWPHKTLRENILLPLDSQNGKKDWKYVDELIMMFGMKEFIDRYPNEVSIGQRQRAAIVRALALKPAYILLDEITSALDVEQVAKVLDHLLYLRDSGIGILIITHLVSFARRAADYVVFLDDGRVAEAGDVTVLDNPKNDRVARFLSLVKSAT